MTNYLKRWIDPAMNQPEITNLSLSHAFLALALCLVSLNVGMYLEESSTRSHGAMLNLMTSGMLLINCLAFQFKWSRSTTACLRIGAWAWLVVVFAALAFYH